MTAPAIDEGVRRAAVTPRLQRALWDLCTSVPGLVPVGVEIDGAAVEGMHETCVSLTGWSPTLHACEISLTKVLDPAAADFHDRIVALVAPLVNSQRARADRALELGIGMPADSGVAEPVSHHLHADASHLAMSLAAHLKMASDDWNRDEDPLDDTGITGDMLQSIARSLSLAHRDATYDGGSAIHSSGCGAYARMSPEGTPICCVGVGATSVPLTSGRVSISTLKNGSTRVSIERAGIPDTLVAAMSGRRMQEVVGMPDSLSAILGTRTIVEAQEQNGSLYMSLAPLDAAFADIAGLAPGEAQRTLAAIIAARTT